MATEIPDIRHLEKWEDAFQYPVPTTRAIEKRLRTSLNENHDKLRTLVGASYRDLLGTARTIIDIDGRLHAVEDLMRNTAHKTDSRHFDRLRKNHAKLEAGIQKKEQDRYTLASQLATLKSALQLVSRFLKSRVSVLLSTKLLILCRILHKSLDSILEARASLGSLAQKLSNLRQRLLQQIDKRLAESGSEINHTAEDLTAFCLATSSSPTDVLKHFYGLRAKAIRRPRVGGKQSVKNCIESRVELFLDTIRQSKSIFPDLLATSLRALGSRSVLEDETVQELEELKLGVHQRWFNEDVVNYTPWTRHDELQRSKADDLLRSWTHAALDALADSIELDLESEEEIESVVSTRRDVIQTWLSTRGAARGLNVQDALAKLRKAFVRRCLTIIATSANDLFESIKTSTIDYSLEQPDGVASQSAHSQWDISNDSSLLSNGGVRFREAISHRRTSRAVAVSHVITSCERAADKIERMHAAFKSMRDTRWDDDYDDSDDESDDDAAGTNVHDLLSRQDPDMLLKDLREHTTRAVQPLGPLFEERCASTDRDTSVFLLRALRELRLRLPQLLATLQSPASQELFAQKSVDALHLALVAHLVGIVSQTHETGIARLGDPLAVKALWEGNPPLPLQVHPRTFRFLRKVVQEMGRLGVDLWNPLAVALCKKCLAEMWTRMTLESYKHIVRERGVALPGEERDEDVSETDEQVKSHGEKKSGEKTIDPETHQDHNSDAQDEKETSKAGDADPSSGREDDTQPLDTTSQDPVINSNHEQPPKPSKLPLENVVQLYFDALYLQHAFMPAPTSTSYTQAQADATFAPLVTKLAEQAGLQEAERARLEKNAREYWRRTYLLFGLLCNG